MKASNMTLGIVAAAVGIWALLRKKKAQPASGIGKIEMNIPASILNKAKKLFDAYDRAIEIEREHDEKCDVIYENLLAQGIDPFADENERVVCNALYQAGLTDENGLTDVMMNRHNARKELLNFIIDKIIPYFPIPASDRALFKQTNNVVYQNRLLDMTRDFVNKQLEIYHDIRDILNY